MPGAEDGPRSLNLPVAHVDALLGTVATGGSLRMSALILGAWGQAPLNVTDMTLGLARAEPPLW